MEIMTNRQWLMEKMKKMSYKEFAKLIHVPEEMDKEIDCVNENCEFKSCTDCKVKWLKSEHGVGKNVG